MNARAYSAFDRGSVCTDSQSERRDVFLQAWRKLQEGGWIYPVHVLAQGFGGGSTGAA